MISSNGTVKKKTVCIIFKTFIYRKIHTLNIQKFLQLVFWCWSYRQHVFLSQSWLMMLKIVREQMFCECTFQEAKAWCERNSLNISVQGSCAWHWARWSTTARGLTFSWSCQSNLNFLAFTFLSRCPEEHFLPGVQGENDYLKITLS